MLFYHAISILLGGELGGNHKKKELFNKIFITINTVK